jgi:hypothetical protein
MNWQAPPGPRHWHLTRDVKPPGQCSACDRDRYQQQQDKEPADEKSGS